MTTRIIDNPTVLDDAFLLISKSVDSPDSETYEFSDISTTIKPSIEFGVIPVGPTFGKKVRIQKITDTYAGTLDITFRTNGYAANDVDRIIGDFCHPPEGKGNGEVFLQFRPFSDAVGLENPERSGTFSFPSWMPFGTGDNESIVEQTITFTLAKDDYKRYYSINPSVFQMIKDQIVVASASKEINLLGTFTAKKPLTYYVSEATMLDAATSNGLKAAASSSVTSANFNANISTKRRVPTLFLTKKGATKGVVFVAVTDGAKAIEDSFEVKTA